MEQEEECAHAEGESRRTQQQEIAELEAEGLHLLLLICSDDKL